ncbi:hypothetical protein CMQ_2342 [Grosmannia clavigera kw1407]|uniref:Uncharacterized protein n=1 Tax=Grosmannia clavigera (strain kw1407 / UAMH 11150) TaxID=655863 RepID=F0XJ78_GROCL|nr:uncharacterized protein CMQ_2342 [Grosmannia clavigera kw1407]EFX02293.1 hypothetical protein CMQ_2342 [Grosmannia clavigera kw1407]
MAPTPTNDDTSSVNNGTKSTGSWGGETHYRDSSTRTDGVHGLLFSRRDEAPVSYPPALKDGADNRNNDLNQVIAIVDQKFPRRTPPQS